jgi:hypothetical protein
MEGYKSFIKKLEDNNEKNIGGGRVNLPDDQIESDY